MTTAVGLGLDDRLSAPDLVMLYLASIGLTAFAFGRAPSLVAATLSVLA